MGAPDPVKVRSPRDADASRDADEFAIVLKPLPREPALWQRLPPTWRQRSFAGLRSFAAAACLMWWVSRRSGAPAPDWFPWVCLVVSAVWIGVTIPGSVVDRILAARLEAKRRQNPGEPWLWDHRWDPRGVSGSPSRRFVRASGKLIYFVIFPCGLVVFGPTDPAVLWVFGTIGGVALTLIAWFGWRIFGIGTAHVAFAKFPFHPGERVTLHLGMSDGGARFERASFCLRRLEDGRAIAPFEWHGVRRQFGIRVERPPGELPGSNHHVTLEFDLPADVAGTRLSATPPACWTLDVIANTSSGPYTESFLIPIYERPAGGT